MLLTKKSVFPWSDQLPRRLLLLVDPVLRELCLEDEDLTVPPREVERLGAGRAAGCDRVGAGRAAGLDDDRAGARCVWVDLLERAGAVLVERVGA